MATTASDYFSRILLAFALLTPQWSSAHIHLPQDHQHSGSTHKHELEIHPAHSFPSLEKRAPGDQHLDLAHEPGESGVLYFASHPGPAKAGKVEMPAPGIVLFGEFPTTDPLVSIATPRSTLEVRNVHETCPQPRAPPITFFSSPAE